MDNENLRKILKIVDDLSRERGYPPTVREISSHIELSLATTHKMLSVLKRRGWVTADARIPRSLRLTELGKDWVNV